MTLTILVTNGLLNKSLAVVRSLGKQHYRVIVAEKTRWHVSGFSKYAEKSLVYPDPVLFEAQFLDWLYTTMTREKVDLLLPTDDDTLKIMVAHQKELENVSRLVVPPITAFQTASNKALTYKLAEQLGVPYPKTSFPNLSNDPKEADILALAKDLTYPILVKPRESSGSRGIRLAKTPEEFIFYFKEIHQSYPNPVLQEWIPPGPKYDVCLLFNQAHVPKAAFSQKELRHFPMPMGPSSACLSVAPDDVMVQMAERLLTELHWVGVADVEFMIDPRDGVPKLMEINPRFWSSLYLSLKSGVDFPKLLVQTAFNEEIQKVTSYKQGVMGRSLFPNDLLHYLAHPNRLALTRSFWTNLGQDELLSKEDPLPLLGFLLSALQHSIRPSTWRFLIHR